MPQIIVTADRSSDRREDAVLFRERVSLADFESDHFAAQLLERLGWAVGDAHDHERTPGQEASGPAPAEPEPTAGPAARQRRRVPAPIGG